MGQSTLDLYAFPAEIQPDDVVLTWRLPKSDQFKRIKAVSGEKKNALVLKYTKPNYDPIEIAQVAINTKNNERHLVLTWAEKASKDRDDFVSFARFCVLEMSIGGNKDFFRFVPSAAETAGQFKDGKLQLVDSNSSTAELLSKASELGLPLAIGEAAIRYEGDEWQFKQLDGKKALELENQDFAEKHEQSRVRIKLLTKEQKLEIHTNAKDFNKDKTSLVEDVRKAWNSDEVSNLKFSFGDLSDSMRVTTQVRAELGKAKLEEKDIEARIAALKLLFSKVDEIKKRQKSAGEHDGGIKTNATLVSATVTYQLDGLDKAFDFIRFQPPPSEGKK